ncbi:PilN domain-containing protein [Planctomycetes bacterium K23_9]
MNTTETARDLLDAANLEGATIERRRSPRQKVRRDRRKGVERSVAMEISPSGIALVIVETNAEQQTSKMIIDRVRFPRDCGPSLGNWTDRTLSETLCEIAAKHQLSGQAVKICLGGAPCVTRVVVGANDDVDSEVADLKERTDRYIGMGRGEKVSCETSARIDAKRKRVWVTVAVRVVVDAIAEAIRSAGMRLAHMEHTMLVLCQILHDYEKDTTEPVLLIVDELGRMDLGISYAGQLLLDYRPAMPDRSVAEGAIVQRHIKCLRRYIWSQMPDIDASLSNIFVTGTESERAALYKSLDDQQELHRHHFPLQELCAGFEIEGEVSEDPGVMAAIGLARSSAESIAGTRNNLVSTLVANYRIPWKSVFRSTWPIAASIVLALVLALSANHHRKVATQIEHQIDHLSSTDTEVRRMRFLIDQHRHRNAQVESIERNIHDPRWAHVLWETGALLPHGAWLDSVHINHSGETHIVGASFTSEAIYDYIDQLKATGVYDSVVLDATSLSRVGNGPAYRFEISAQINHAIDQGRAQTFARTHSRSIHRG